MDEYRVIDIEAVDPETDIDALEHFSDQVDMSHELSVAINFIRKCLLNGNSVNLHRFG